MLMGRLSGKVALITGGARGQGRAHAEKMAEEGADIVVTDICEQIGTVPYAMATQEDLDETVMLVEKHGRQCLGIKADARDAEAMTAAVEQTVGEFGHIDVLSVNHGIVSSSSWDQWTTEAWNDIIDTNLNAVWTSIRPVIPHMVAQNSGSIVITSSASGLQSQVGLLPYMTSKHGVIGLGKALAAELAPHWVRVNIVCPGNVSSPMLKNQYIYDLFAGKPGSSVDDMLFAAEAMQLLPTPWLDPSEISNMVAFLASDEAKCITGATFSVDAGMVNQPPGVPPIAAERLARLSAGG
jgi:(+)-trans-carveol dehydrogenase